MKALLACLMCLVLTVSQAFAISGGPFGGGKRHVLVTGTYAGVLIPAVDPVTGTADPNSMALFTVMILSGGEGSGTIAIFRNGFFYPNGVMQANANPASGELNAIISSMFPKTYISGSITNTFNFNANGHFGANQSGVQQPVKIVAKENPLSLADIRIRGPASISYTTELSTNNPDYAAGNSGGAIPYIVRGFKQSF